jgi:hypothetical protein
MEAKLFLRLTKSSLETMEMIYMYTKVGVLHLLAMLACWTLCAPYALHAAYPPIQAIATAPDKTISSNFNFCPHVDRSVKV